MNFALPKSFLKNSIILILAVIWCVYSGYKNFSDQQKINYQIPYASCNTLEIDQGDTLVQEIQINEYITHLRLFVANGGEGRAEINQGEIEFIVRQGEVEEKGTISINGIQDWTYIDLPIDLKKFENGKATLEIVSIDTHVGSSIYFTFSTKNIYEIPAAIYNGAQLDGPLCVEYTTQNMNFNAKFYIICFFLIAIITLLLIVIITFYPKNIYIYMGTSVLIFLIIAFRYPSYTIAGEAWAEVGNLYVPSALTKTFLGNLLTLEAGLYINTIGRLTTWIFVKLMPSLNSAVIGINISSLIFLSLMGAALSSGVLKKYIKPLEGIVISVLITTCLVDGETIATPLITSYWAIIPLLVILAAIALKMQISQNYLILWSILIFISTLSRMSYVVLIPILIMYVIWFRKDLSKRKVRYIVFITGLCLLEGIVSLVLRRFNGIDSSTAVGAVHIGSPVELINGVFYYQVQVINSLLRLQSTDSFAVWNYLCLFALGFFIITLFVCIFKKKHTRYAKAILLLLALSFGQCCLQLVTEGFSPLGNGVDWDIVQSLPRNRQWLFCYIAWCGIALLTFAYCRYLLRKQSSQKPQIIMTVLISFVFVCACSVQSTTVAEYFYNVGADEGDWDNYYTMMDNEAYCIPLAPQSWMATQNCVTVTGVTESANQLELSVQESNIISFYIDRDNAMNQITKRPYYLMLYDANGNVVNRIQQISDLEENLIGFEINQRINGLSKIEFTYEDGSPAYVAGNYILAYN